MLRVDDYTYYCILIQLELHLMDLCYLCLLHSCFPYFHLYTSALDGSRFLGADLFSSSFFVHLFDNLYSHGDPLKFCEAVPQSS